MIRMQRVGRKHEPVYRLVLTDSKNGPKSGRFIDILGNYDSRNAEKAVFNDTKIKEWISKGAKLSATANNLLIRRKVIEGKIISVIPKGVIEKARAPKEEPQKEESASTTPVDATVPEAPVAETPVEEAHVSEPQVQEEAPEEVPTA